MRQQELFETDPKPRVKHTRLLRRRSKLQDFRGKVRDALDCYQPAAMRGLEGTTGPSWPVPAEGEFVAISG
jgi:hypothetical protein